MNDETIFKNKISTAFWNELIFNFLAQKSPFLIRFLSFWQKTTIKKQ